MEDRIEDEYCRDVISLPLVIKGHVVRKRSWIGDQYVDLDVEIVRNNKIHRFLVVVKRVEVLPSEEPEFAAEVESLKQKFELPVYLAVVNEDMKKLWLSEALMRKMAFPDDEYSLIRQPRHDFTSNNPFSD